MLTRARAWMAVLALLAGLALADSPDEAKMSGEELARSATGFLQAEPPNLEMALDRLKDALEKPEGLDVNYPTTKVGGFQGQNHADSHGSLPPGTGGLHRPSGFDPAAK